MMKMIISPILLTKKKMMMVIKGGTKQQREIAEKVIRWCFEKKIVIRHDIDIHMEIVEDSDCWGSCVDSFNDRSMSSFDITIFGEQTMRDFVATIMHEMVHVNQYITGRWTGDGEKEAEDRQYELTDKLMKENNL